MKVTVGANAPGTFAAARVQSQNLQSRKNMMTAKAYLLHEAIDLATESWLGISVPGPSGLAGF